MRKVLALAAVLAALASPAAAEIVVGWEAPNLQAEVRQGATLCAYSTEVRLCRKTEWAVPGVVTGYFEDGTALVGIEGMGRWVASQSDVTVIEANGGRVKLVRWIMGKRDGR